jgi:hypothetical protein
MDRLTQEYVMAILPVVIEGMVTADGKLLVSENLALPAGPVRITIQPVAAPQPSQTDWWETLQRARAVLEARGTGFRSQEEIEAEHASFRVEKD